MARNYNLGKKDSTRHELRAAIHKALRHLEERYDDSPCTEELAKMVGLSTYHFHRAFRDIVGETVAKYHNRIRIERAAAILKSSNWQIGEIGLACGFETSASFSRAFKRLYGKSPGEFRDSQGVVPFLRGHLRTNPERSLPTTDFVSPTVAVEEWTVHQVITLRFVGSTNDILKPWAELLTWAKKNLKHMEQARYFGLWFDDWSQLDENRYRYECAILPNEPVTELPKPFHWRTIPAGKVATVNARGTFTELDHTWKSFANGWLPFSGYQPREDFAMDEYPAELAITPLPKKVLLGALGNISIRLCLPIQVGPVMI